MKKLFSLFIACAATLSAMAWTAQPKSNSQFYIFNDGANLWIGVNAEGKPATFADKSKALLVTVEGNYFYYVENDTKHYIAQSKGVSSFANEGKGITTWTEVEDTKHFYIDDHVLFTTGDTRFMDATGDGNQLSFPKRDNKSEHFDNWILIAPSEYADSMRTFNEYAETVCESELPYVDAFFGELNEAGEYRDTIVNVAGFDSVMVFTLTINAIERITLDTLYGHVGEEIEIFGRPYTFDAAIDTVMYDTLAAANGCDSILIQPVAIAEAEGGLETALSKSVRADKATKFIENGILYMLKGDALYDMRGQRLR